MRMSFRNTFLIARREYLERVRSRFFRITTVLIPVGVAGLAMLGGMSGKKLEGVQMMAVASSDPVLAREVKTSLQGGEMAPKMVTVVTPLTDAQRTELNEEVA